LAGTFEAGFELVFGCVFTALAGGVFVASGFFTIFFAAVFSTLEGTFFAGAFMGFALDIALFGAGFLAAVFVGKGFEGLLGNLGEAGFLATGLLAF